jgi:hypothetical protein
MKTANRKPKLHKPSKGMKQQFKQGLKAFKKAVSMATGPTNKTTNWNRPAEVRARWLIGFSGGVNAHQGAQECARRVRQMNAHKCIDTGSWTS